MTWRDLLLDWHDQLDLLSRLFPHADPLALARFRGNRALLAQYIADTHDLTLAEGHEAIELWLLPAAAINAAETRLVAAQ